MYHIYHNPRCSKSRQTFQLLKDNGIEPEVILYLENPPNKSELQDIAKLLGMKPIEFTRRKESEFKQAGLSKDSSDVEVLNAMVKYPKLIERPIVIKDNKKAVLGRPPESVLGIL